MSEDSSSKKQTTTGGDIEAQVLETLVEGYSACDISDVLLKLKVPGAGFLPDILPLTSPSQPPRPRFAAPISTLLFVPISAPPPSPPSNLPGTHWTDAPSPNTVCLVQQPPHQSCAVVGDILATRLAVRGVKGVIVDGRVRDVSSLRGLEAEKGFGVWSKGVSTVGSGLEAKAWACDVPITVGRVVVRAGDVLVADAEERGVVVIPRDKLDDVVRMLPAVKAADDAVVTDVQNGVPVHEAFKKHRG